MRKIVLIGGFAGMCALSLWLGAEVIISMRADSGGLFRYFSPVSQTILLVFFTSIAAGMGALMLSRILSNPSSVLACLRVAAVFGVIIAIFAVFFFVMRVVAVFV